MLKNHLTFGYYNLSNAKIIMKGEKRMSAEELTALLVAELKDDVIGTIEKTENGLKLIFTDGTVRMIFVK